MLLISSSLCALSEEGKKKKGEVIIRGVESSNRWNNVPLLLFLPRSPVMTPALMERALWGWHSNADIWIMSVYQRENAPPAFVVPPRVSALAGCRWSHEAAHTWRLEGIPEGRFSAVLWKYKSVHVETVYTKNFNGFYFKRLQQKSHQIVTTDIKSLIVTNPRPYRRFICTAYSLAGTSADTILWLDSVTIHVNLQEASYT